MNIVSLIMQFLTPALMSRIASGLGADNSLVGKAIAAALPAILAGIVGKSSSPDGLKQLTNVLGQQDPGLLGNLTNMLGSANQTNLVDSGNSMLGSLLGGSSTGALTNAVGKFSGLGEAPSKGLLGILAPVVLGTLASQQKSNNLDANGLASLLAGQKSNIQAAMPAGFSDLLGGSGLLDGLSGAGQTAGQTASGAMRSATQAAGSAATSAVNHASRTATASVEEAKSTNWLPWAAAAAAIALLGWYFLGSAGNVPAPTTTNIVYNNVDVGKQVTTLFDGLKTTVGTIKDKATAEAAMPALQTAVSEVTKLKDLSGQLPADGKKGLAGLIASLLPVLQPIINKALGSPDAAGVAKPVLDQIISGLTALSKA
jgi:hypothetical protein